MQQSLQRTFLNYCCENEAKLQTIKDDQERAYIETNRSMDPATASLIYCQSQETKRMMLTLPTTKRSLSLLSTMLVPLPLEGKKLEYMLITDGPTIEHLLFCQNIQYFAQSKVTLLAPSQVMNKVGVGA